MTPFFFDALYLDGDALVDEPLSRRVSRAGGAVRRRQLVPRLVTADADGGGRVRQRALATGHEGVMAKALDGRTRPAAAERPGSR